MPSDLSFDTPMERKSTNHAPSSGGNRLGFWDVAGMLTGFLLTLAITCALSRGRLLWEDEMLGWVLLRDPSWHHMLQAWKLGADGGGFTFYLAGRGWFALFGPSALSFRLFSSTCFGLAFIVTWAALRRFYGTGVVYFALFNTFFFSNSFLLHMGEGRFYGLLTLGVALAVWLALELIRAQRRTCVHLYVLTFLIHALLTTSHLLGVVFSAFLLGSVAWYDLQKKTPRALLYLAGTASWLLLLAERANIRSSAAVGKPHFWTKAPTLTEAAAVYSGSSHEIAAVLLVLTCIAAWAVIRNKAGWKHTLRALYEQRAPLYVVTASLLLVPLAFLVQGLLGTWLFNDRYLLPVTIGLVYLTAELLEVGLSTALGSLVRSRGKRWTIGICWKSAYVLFVLFWVFHHRLKGSHSSLDYTAQIAEKLPKNLPIVCEDAFTFTELLDPQHPTGLQFTYLLDWTQSISPSAPRLEVMQYHLMQNWKKAGYFSTSIYPLQEFLEEHDEFLVMHAGTVAPMAVPPEIGNPLAERFRKDPAFTVRRYAEIDRGDLRDTVWLVCSANSSARSACARNG